MTDRIPQRAKILLFKMSESGVTPEHRRKAEQVFDKWIATPSASWPELICMIATAIAEAEEAVREMCCKAICENCANELPLEWLNDAWWHIGSEPYSYTVPCKAIAILAKDGTGE